MAAATRGRQADGAPEGIPYREDSNCTRNADTRLFEHENNDQSIQPCIDREDRTGSPRVVQRHRFSSDTDGVGSSDFEGVVERVGCVGGYICRADCLGVHTAIASILLLLRTRFRFDQTSPRIHVRKRQLQISIRGSGSYLTPTHCICWRQASFVRRVSFVICCQHH